jgi:hypothetical protein
MFLLNMRERTEKVDLLNERKSITKGQREVIDVLLVEKDNEEAKSDREREANTNARSFSDAVLRAPRLG